MKITEILKYVEENTNSAFFYTPNIIKGGKSYLFKKPSQILKGKTKAEIETLLSKVDELSQDPNLIGFATIPYEIGYHFQPKEIKNSYLDKAELIFYFYHKSDVKVIESSKLEFDGVEKILASIQNIKDFNLDVSKDEYVEKVEKIKKYIAEGDTYQINFTTKAKFKFNGKLTSLFLSGIFNQSASYSVIINGEKEFILSFSPELFFSTDYKSIFGKPMKGTLKRKENPVEDDKLAKSLLRDEKNLAENVMIVDLMRNDIGRIAVADSVRVKKLYEIEKYETLYQLTSTVEGKLKNGKLSEIINNMFPSGSITGAPKIRSMQIISELEKSPRNLYTGSIGLITNSEAVFNIPIRTIRISKTTKKGELGLGSGIVWDSDAESEYEEVMLKGKFISSPPKYFELLETMLFENGECFLLGYHLKRLKHSADYFLFKYDKDVILNEIEKNITKLSKSKKYKIRILLNKWGNIKVSSKVLNISESKAKVLLSKAIRCDINKFLYHKTSYRPWDVEFKQATEKGFDEVLFVNKNDEILEGAITNLVIENDGKYFTPPLELGILNGCYRQFLINNKMCEEKLLTIDDLKRADKISLCNSVRKEIIIERIYNLDGELIYNSK